MADNLDLIRKIFGPIKLIDASYTVYAQATYYPHFIRVYLPNVPYTKIHPNMEPTKPLIRTKMRSGETIEENIERSLRRSQKAVKDYSLCNEFELFMTFTFKSDRQDLEKCRSKMSNWLKNQRKRVGKFEYLIVAELHKDNQSLHFHALFKGYKGNLVESINPKTGKPLIKKGRQVYDITSYTLGHCDVYKIDDNPESHEKVGGYLRKYITKDMPQFHGRNRFWASRGLSLPKVIDNPPTWYLRGVPLRTYEFEYGAMLDFPLEADTSDDVSRSELGDSSK